MASQRSGSSDGSDLLIALLGECLKSRTILHHRPVHRLDIHTFPLRHGGMAGHLADSGTNFSAARSVMVGLAKARSF